ncbi:MAG: trxA [Pedosphaera sp.]|nr:trxA [Pedosphaera sp.]
MKRAMMMALMVLGMATLAQAQTNEWFTDLPKAQSKAASEKKTVFMDFTGSDWCPPCKALKKNVLSSPEFEAYAKKNLVLVEVDFPKSKPQSEELKKANEELSKRFNVEGYPTVILLSPEGKELSKATGYGGESPKAFIQKLDTAAKKEKAS